MKRRLSQTIFAVLACAFCVLFVTPSFSVFADSTSSFNVGIGSDDSLTFSSSESVQAILRDSIYYYYSKLDIDSDSVISYQALREFLPNILGSSTYSESGVCANVFFSDNWSHFDSGHPEIASIYFTKNKFYIPSYSDLQIKFSTTYIERFPFFVGKLNSDNFIVPFFYPSSPSTFDDYYYFTLGENASGGSSSITQYTPYNLGGNSFCDYSLDSNTYGIFNINSECKTAIINTFNDWLRSSSTLFVIHFNYGYGRVYINLGALEGQNSDLFTNNYFTNNTISYYPNNTNDIITMFPVFVTKTGAALIQTSSASSQINSTISVFTDFDSLPLSLYNESHIFGRYVPGDVTPTPAPTPTRHVWNTFTPTPQSFPTAFPTLSLSDSDLEDSISDVPDSILTLIDSAGLFAVFNLLVDIVLRSELGSVVIAIVSFAAFAFVIGLTASGVARVVAGRDSSIKTGKVDEPLDALTYFEHKYYDND